MPPVEWPPAEVSIPEPHAFGVQLQQAQLTRSQCAILSRHDDGDAIVRLTKAATEELAAAAAAAAA